MQTNLDIVLPVSQAVDLWHILWHMLFKSIPQNCICADSTEQWESKAKRSVKLYGKNKCRWF